MEIEIITVPSADPPRKTDEGNIVPVRLSDAALNILHQKRQLVTLRDQCTFRETLTEIKGTIKNKLEVDDMIKSLMVDNYIKWQQ